MPAKKQHHTMTATLINGREYHLLLPNPANPKNPSAIIFKNGEAVPVSSHVIDHLKEHACDVETITVAGGRKEQRRNCKFEFLPVQNATPTDANADAVTPET
jgi:hypothetical protein